MGKSLKQLSR